MIEPPIANLDAHVDGAMALYATGDHAGAQALCRTVLHADPNNLRALYLYGTLLLQAGRPADAVDALSRAVDLAPAFAGTRINLGVAYRSMGRLVDAAAAYRAAIDIDPSNADVHMNLGNCLKDMGRFADAEEAYRRCLLLKPGYALAYDNLGTCLREQDRLDDAVDAFRKAIDLDPNLAAVYNDLGGTLLTLGRIDDARGALSVAVRLDPTDYRAWNNLADTERRSDNFELGAGHAAEAARLNPSFAEAYFTAGLCLNELHQPSDAVDCYRRALELRPDYVEATYNLARCLRFLQRYDEAIELFEKAIALKPDFAEAHNALGALYQEIVEVDKAIACYDRAIEIEPSHITAHWNRGLMRLTIGDYDRGLTDFEWRYKLAHIEVDYPNIPIWNGESLDGVRLLVRAEQGFGDTVQFVRFLTPLTAAGARITLECQPGLGDLLRDANLCETVVDRDPAGPPPGVFDKQVWLMSIPGILGVMFDTIPADIPYLRVPGAVASLWKAKLDDVRAQTGRPFLAGIVWAGSRKNSNDHLRSMSIEHASRIDGVDGVTLVSLQQGPPVTKIPEWSGSTPLVVPTPVVRSFTETAAMIESLDVVITVDTVVAHIAGALGRPVWMMIPYGPDWRWSIHRSDTPWYPSMRIFRQPTPGDWPSTVDAVKTALIQASAK